MHLLLQCLQVILHACIYDYGTVFCEQLLELKGQVVSHQWLAEKIISNKVAKHNNLKKFKARRSKKSTTQHHESIYLVMLSYTMCLRIVSIKRAFCKKLGSSSMNFPTKLYALMLSHTICLLMAFVREENWKWLGISSMKCPTITYALVFSHTMLLSMVIIRKAS